MCCVLRLTWLNDEDDDEVMAHLVYLECTRLVGTSFRAASVPNNVHILCVCHGGGGGGAGLLGLAIKVFGRECA